MFTLLKQSVDDVCQPQNAAVAAVNSSKPSDFIDLDAEEYGAVNRRLIRYISSMVGEI